MGISSLMGYKDGGDADAKKDTFDTSFDKYQSRLSALRTPSQPVSFYDVASKLGAGLLAQQAEKFPSIGRGLGLGFQSLSEEIAKRREQKRKEEEAVAMKAMELAITDERQAQKYLNDYALKMIDMANKDIKTITLDTSMLVGAVGPDGEPLVNTQTGVPFRDETTLKANDPYVSELLGLGAVAKDRAGVTINQQGGNELDKRRAANIADAEAKWQEEADAATALRDQVAIARALAEDLGEKGFGAAESLTLGMRNIIAGLGFDNLVDVDKLATQQALTQTSIGFVMALVGKTKGAISNREMEIFFAASPTLGSTYEGYMKQLELLERFSRRDRDFYFDYLEKMDEIEERQPPVSEQKKYTELEKYAEEWRDDPENSLFTPEETEMLENIVKTRQGLADDFVPRDFEKLFNDKKEEIAKKAKIESAISSQSNQDELIKMRDEIESKLNNNEYPEDEIEKRKKQLRQLNAELASG